MFNYGWGHLGLMACESTIWYRRCRAIENELKRHCIKSSVSRHTLFDTEYYLIEVSDNKEHISDKRIADALNIPRDWVCLYHCRAGEKTYYAVLEDELNDKYRDCNGNLVFDEPFNLKKYFKDHDVDEFKCKFESLMNIRTSDWVYDSYTDTVLLRVFDERITFDRQKISKVLNIPYSSVGAFYLPNDGEWVYSIYLGDGDEREGC